MPDQSVVTVTMQKRDGWYIATSPNLIGLIVCHQNLVKFTQEIPECIRLLYRANYDMDVDVQEIPSMDDVATVTFQAIRKAA